MNFTTITKRICEFAVIPWSNEFDSRELTRFFNENLDSAVRCSIHQNNHILIEPLYHILGRIKNLYGNTSEWNKVSGVAFKILCSALSLEGVKNPLIEQVAVPAEVMCKIFTYFNDLKTIRLVSKSWAGCAQTAFEKSIRNKWTVIPFNELSRDAVESTVRRYRKCLFPLFDEIPEPLKPEYLKAFCHAKGISLHCTDMLHHPLHYIDPETLKLTLDSDEEPVVDLSVSSNLRKVELAAIHWSIVVLPVTISSVTLTQCPQLDLIEYQEKSLIKHLTLDRATDSENRLDFNRPIYTTLESLVCLDCHELLPFIFPDEMPHLKTLILDCDNWDLRLNQTNFPQLTELDIATRSIILPNCPLLKRLTITEASLNSAVCDLTSYKYLEEVCLEDILDLETLKLPPSIRHVHINGCTALENFQLAPGTNLKSLKLIDTTIACLDLSDQKDLSTLEVDSSVECELILHPDMEDFDVTDEVLVSKRARVEQSNTDID